MTILRAEKNVNYTCINNTIVKDPRLSWKAKGIWLYAMSRPNNWTFYLADLINQSTDGRDAVQSGLKELQQTGYLVRKQIRLADGKLSSLEWTFTETPIEKIDSIDTFEPETGFPVTDNPATDNPPLLNTDPLLSTEKQQRGASHVVVFSCLDDIDVLDSFKQKITAQYTELEVETAVQRLKDCKNLRSTIEAFLMDSLINKYPLVKKTSELEASTASEALERLSKFEHRNLNGFKFTVGLKDTTITFGAHAYTFSYTDKKFWSNIREFFNRANLQDALSCCP